MLRRAAARRELRRLLQGRPNVYMAFSPQQLAASLWDYAEDELAERALTVSQAELQGIQNIAVHYELPDYPLPMTEQIITHNHVMAFAAVTFFEGEVRALQRTRRRPQKDRPARFSS